MYRRVHHTFLLSALISFAIFLQFSLHVYADDENEQALVELREKIGKLRKEIEKTQNLHDSVRTELSKVERDISEIHRELKHIDRRQQKQNRALRKLYNDRKKLQYELETHQRILAQQVQAAYIIGQQEYLKLILNQEDPSSIGRTMTYYEYLNRARLSEIEAARLTLVKLDAVEKKISVEKRTLNELEQQQIAKQQELQKVSHDHALVMAKLQKQLESKGQELSQLVANERRLQDLVNQLDEAIPDILTAPGKRTPFAKLRGKLKWPTTGNVQALFGRSRNVGKLRWNGIVIDAREGKEIRAISHGRVAYADWLRGYGLLLILDHGDGYMSLYGHNQSLFKETGEWVEAGEVIASVGRSGGQQQAGLYFEIRHNGKPSNPTSWCKKG